MYKEREKLFYGGPVLTMNEACMRPEAVLVRGERIAAVGPLEALRRAAPGAEPVDLEGRALLPGFIDAHSHLVQFANNLQYASLTGADSLDEIARRLREFVRKNNIAPGTPVIGTGYDHNDLPGRAHPTRQFLDAALPGYPVVLGHASGHMGCVSSLVLGQMGVTRQTADPQGGRIGRDEAGEPNGYLEELAFSEMVAKAMPAGQKGARELLRRGQQAYLSHGITTAQDGFMKQAEAQLLAEAARAGELALDVVGYCDMKENAGLPGRLPEFRQRYSGRFKIGGYKIFLDGSPQGRTAWVTTPYLGGEAGYVGYPIYTEAQVREFVGAAQAEGMQLLCHCNGDAAAAQFLAAHTVPSTQRNVMIHAQLLRPDQLPAVKAAGIIPSYFVAHTWYWGDTHIRNFGLERARNISPAADTVRLGIPYTFHMDSPVLPPDCMDILYCAVNRRTKGGVSLAAGQQISALEALRGLTVYGAYQYHEEGEKGSLAPGKTADLVLLSADPTAVEAEELRSVRVEATYKAGEKVYKA